MDATAKSQEKVTPNNIYRAIEAQQFLCPLTGERLEPSSASLDHIVPLSKGGKHEMSNVWIVSKTVNAAKGTMALEEFIAMCKAVADRADRGLIHAHLYQV
jgi:5-methylcytosine-specific restriction endonuclease McrA